MVSATPRATVLRCCVSPAQHSLLSIERVLRGVLRYDREEMIPMNKRQYRTCIQGGSLPVGEYLLNARCNDIKPKDILWQVGSWAVTSYGLESLSFYYPIEAKRLR